MREKIDDTNTTGGIIESFHTINNLRLYSKSSRKGKPNVIFIAGLGDSSEAWNEVQHRISQVTSTLSYDRAGVGRSEAAPVPRTCLDLVEELSALLAAIDMEPPYLLVGHSFGGLEGVAQASHSRKPRILRKSNGEPGEDR